MKVFISEAGIFLFGKIRRTDWLPVDGHGDEQLCRSCDSESEDEHDEQDRKMEDLYSGSESDDGAHSDCDEFLYRGGAESDLESDDDDYERGALAGLTGDCDDLAGLTMQ